MMVTTIPAPGAGARDHHRPGRGVVVATVVGVLALLSVVGYSGYQLGRSEPASFEARVVQISSDGDSLCVEPSLDGDTCGQPVIAPEDRDRVRRGVTVQVTKLWVDQQDGKRLLFVVDLPD